MAGDISTAAQVTSAAFAAAAAGASWASVLQSRRTIRASALPELHVQILVQGTLGNVRQPIVRMAVFNGGGGIAKGTGFVLRVGGQYAVDHVGDGFLKPGHTAHVHTEMPPADPDQMLGVAFCRDLRERSYAWNKRGERREMRRTRRRPFHTAEELWAAFYPDLPLESLSRVRAHIEAPEFTL